MRAEAKRRARLASVLLFLPFLLHTRVLADPFPKPLAEERRGGLLFIPMRGPVDPYDSTFEKSHRHRHHRLTFESVGVDSDILAAAFKRYETILTTPCLHMAYEFDVVAPETLLDPSNRVDRVLVYVQSADLTLDLYTDEAYSIRISSPDVTIEAQSVYGALRALETLAQSVHVVSFERVFEKGSLSPRPTMNFDGDPGSVLVLNETALYDAPRFNHRGVLLDTARHYLPVDVIKTHMDAMVMVKMNVLHWHLTDDESWPYVVGGMPEVSGRGAFSARRVYGPDAVDEVVAYGKARGIRVVVEFDSPGHAGSLQASHPEVFVPCLDDYGAFPLLNPASNATYDLLWRVLRDAAKAFPDRAWHFGGNDVRRIEDCWGGDAAVMEAFGGDVRAALEGHARALMGFAAAMGRVPIVYLDLWEAVLGGRERVLPVETTVVQVLREGGGSWAKAVDRVTKAGYRAVLSAPWTLGRPSPSPSPSWKAFYGVEPLSFSRRASLEQSDRVLGGEVVVWGELMDETNSVSETWPTAAAVAERLWSDRKVTDVVDAEQRMVRVRCRMLARGVGAGPVHGEVCPFV